MIFFFPKLNVLGGGSTLCFSLAAALPAAAAAAARPAGPPATALAPGVAEVGRPPSPGMSRSSFSPERSPCENRRLRNEVVEVNLELKLANDEILLA